MKKTLLVLVSLIIIQAFAQDIKPPIAKRIDSIRILHGDTTHDYYDWMHSKKNNQFINYLYEENAYADRIMKDSWLLRKRLYEEQREMIIDEFTSDSVLNEEYWYSTSYEKGKDYPKYIRRRDTIGARKNIYFDGNKLAEKYSYFSLSTFSISPNQELLAYAINSDGSDKGYLFIKQLDTDTLLKEEIANLSGFVWVNDSIFLYTIEDKKTKRADKLYRHTLGKDVKSDSLIYYEQNTKYNISLGKTRSKAYIKLTRSSFLDSETYYFKTSEPFSKFRLFQTVIPNKTYGFSHYKGDSIFYVNTNWGNDNGRLMQCDINKTKKENWTDIINPPDSQNLADIFIYRNHFVYTYSTNGLNKIVVRNRETGKEDLIQVDGDNYVLSLSKSYGYDSLKFNYSFTNLIQPSIIHQYNLETQKDSIIKTDTTVTKYNKDEFITKRLWATASDGTKVPLDIVHKKGIKLDGTNPTLMYAYACYGNNSYPYFSEQKLIYLRRGFIYAIAHPRGESILGDYWHKDGKLLNKKNTYTDFIACAEFLIDSGYTSSEKIAAKGGSAGGMLMGAVVTMRPDLFKCIIPNVPFVDVLYQMQDTLWPNIIPHFDEMGNPFIKEQYDSIKTWCPYQNTNFANYPDILVTSGFNDSRVPVWSPAKWVSKLRYHKKDSNLLLFRTNMEAGHGGGSGRYKYLKESSFELAFIMRSLGIKEEYLSVKGKVYDQNNELLPFVNVYLKGTSQGTTTNYDGEFSIDLKKGTKHTLVFQYVGFDKEEVKVDINTNTRNLKIVLKTGTELLPSAIVTADGEDPAYAIIKQAQNNRKKHLKEVEAYSVDIYIKGIGRLNEVPKKIPAFMKSWELPDSNDLGLLNLEESVAKYFYRAPDDYKEQMIASKVAGTNRGYSWNRAKDVMLNFYKNNIPMGWFGERGFVSPIAGSAMMYYKYKLLSVNIDNGITVYKIKVIPRRKHDPVFKGDIYITDKTWSIYTVDLVLAKATGLKMIDSLEIKQTHIPINDSIWMPFTIQFKQHFKIFGFGGNQNSVGTFSNYNISPHFDKDFFGNEVFRIEDEANKQDSIYWDKSRYIVLTDEEKGYYKKTDSILLKHKDPIYLDSLKRARNKFKFGNVLLSQYEYKNYPKYYSWQINSIIGESYYNTVEGLVLGLNAGLSFFDKEDVEDNNMWFWNGKTKILPKLNYSITNNQLYGTIDVYTNNIRLSAGRSMSNYTEIDKLSNMIYTLLVKENYAKIYQKDYVSASYWKRIMRGLTSYASLSYQRRTAMQNNADFSFYDYADWQDKEFTSNNPLDPSNDALSFEQHDVLIAKFGLTIKFKQKYSTYPGGKKYYHSSKYPTIYINYKRGFYTTDSRPGFDYAQIAVSDKIDMKLFGKSVYTISSGGFFSGQNDLEFIDYRHFQGNQTIFLQPSWGVQSAVPFNSLNYFESSTNNYFVAARWEHHFNGWIFNKLPLLRKLKFEVLAGTAALYTPSNNLFTEVFIGAENIFNAFRIDFVTNYQNEKINPMIRVGIDIGL